MQLNHIVFIIILSPIAFASESKIHISRPIEFEEKTIQGEVSPSDLKGLEDLNVKLGNSKDSVLELSAGGTTKSVHSCRQYNEAKKQGFQPDTTFALRIESFFKSDYATGGTYRHYEYLLLNPEQSIAEVRRIGD